MKNLALFSSTSQDWKTPKKVYDGLDKEFGFDFDPCPVSPNFDGLLIEWGKSNFVNPPYTTKLQNAFAKKGLAEYRKGKTVVFLVPARTSTKRFHEIFLPLATEIRFIKGRLYFNDGEGRAPFPSMIVIFKHVPLTVKDDWISVEDEPPPKGEPVWAWSPKFKRSYTVKEMKDHYSHWQPLPAPPEQE